MKYSILDIEKRTIILEDTTDEVTTYKDYLRTYAPSYDPSPFQDDIAEQLEYWIDLAKETGRRYYIFIIAPPQHGKSYVTSGFYPSYHFCKYPTDNVLCWTHSLDLALDFAASNRDMLLDNDLPTKILSTGRKKRSALKEWHTFRGGKFKAAGLKTRMVGKGFELIFVDDIYPGESEYLSKAYNLDLRRTWDSSITKRLRHGCCVVFPSVRYGTDDLCGYVQSRTN